MLRRNRQRQKTWAKHFETALQTKSYRIPYPTVIQLIPTEACNLRCPMCNQWGKNGYLPKGARPVQHMDKDSLTTLIRGLSPVNSLISIHGGEPFVYKHIDPLLDLLQEKPFDVMISTNGTLISRFVEPLTKIKNLGLLLSIDGDRETHDKIRGNGRYDEAKDGLAALFDSRRRAGIPLPMTFMNIVVCEWTTDIMEKAFDAAHDIGAFCLHYNMRWFVTEEIGQAYEKDLQTHFKITSTGAWKGWVSNPADYNYKPTAAALASIKKKKRFRISPPLVVTLPEHLKGKDFETYFYDYTDVFGCETCFMPFYWSRIHSNGDLVYCPGHPDIVGGNVFRDGLAEAFNSQLTIKFRKHILHHRFPICNRCCGLYMPWHARRHEQTVRRKLGLAKNITVHYS